MRLFTVLAVVLGLAFAAPVMADEAAKADAPKVEKAEKKADKAEKKADKAEKKEEKAEKKADKAEKKADAAPAK